MRKALILCGSVALAACASNPESVKNVPPLTTAMPSSTTTSANVADEAVPDGARLPTDVRPIAQSIELRIFPEEARFSGTAEIAVRLDKARSVIWLHAKKLDVARATVTPKGGASIEAKFDMRDPSGLGALALARAIPAGEATLRLEFSGEFAKGLKGLYKTQQSGRAYAFTQFEATAAREAFPCFDEPGFKIPFDVTLVVPKDAEAIANTHDTETKDDGNAKRVKFATTERLPTYLVAFAVGPLDVVKAPDVPPNEVRQRPLPLRAITAKGRGPEVSYALAHTGEIVATIEKYLGVAYPYDKLDILAVPDKTGAMENAGAITFRELLLLMDEKTASISQKRRYAGVMAHEVAHQWFGDLVTMKWWDDTWLNEAFATWMAPKAVDAWDPSMKSGLNLLDGVQGAMGTDALVSARAIRQPIASHHDIENAFDGITYQKGAGVIRMFEQWMGEAAFQKGIRAYLEKHRFGNASADDLLDVLTETSGKDIKTPFHTFLDQAGVPFVEAEVRCDKGGARMHVKQSRYLPIGSSGDASRVWQIPITVRIGRGEHETAQSLLTAAEGDVPLGAKCPAWVMPNADAAGYYRFALAPNDLKALRTNGLASLSVREKIAFTDSVRAGFARGTTPMKDAVLAVAPLASDPDPHVASAAMGYLDFAREWLFEDALRPKVEQYAGSLYRRIFDKLGWRAAKKEDPDRATLRARVLAFLVFTANDHELRAESVKLARAYLGVGKDDKIHTDAVDANLAPIVLAVAGEEADVALWDALLAQMLKTEDDSLRSRLLTALGRARKPELAERARALTLDKRLRVTEALSPLANQLDALETREATWDWIKKNFDEILAHVPAHHGGPALLGAVDNFCDEAHAKDAEEFLSKRAEAIDGGPRALATALEHVRLCAAKRKAQEPSAREMFAHGVR